MKKQNNLFKSECPAKVAGSPDFLREETENTFISLEPRLKKIKRLPRFFFSTEFTENHKETQRKIIWTTILKREFEFLTNLFDFRANMIAALYKNSLADRIVIQAVKAKFSVKIFSWRQRKCHKNTNLLRLDSQFIDDGRPKTLEAALVVLKFG